MQEAPRTRLKPVTEKKKEEIHRYPAYSPRFWHGMRFGHWMGLLFKNGFQIGLSRAPTAMAISLMTPANSLMNILQQAFYGGRIRRTEISQPPVFILGHWRSGTTYLHELMVRDESFTYPNTFQCFAPYHILLTEWIFTRYMGFLMPRQRPMDNMAAGWLHPQEDEFALLAMGAPSPYRRMAFPNRSAPDLEWLDMSSVDDRKLRRWKKSLDLFVRLLTYRDKKRVVLKSPPHTGRIQVLAEMFPGARFVHIVRHPYAVFPSTRRLWRSLDYVQGLHRPKNEHVDDYIFDCYERMYGGFHKQRESIAPEHIVDVKYEELVQNPVSELERIYDHLDLGDFAKVRGKIEGHVRSQKDYKPNQHELEPEIEARIQQRWADYFDRYGYDR